MTEVGATGRDDGMTGGQESPASESPTTSDDTGPDDRRRRQGGSRGPTGAELRAFSAELLADRRDGAVLVPAKARASAFADDD